MFDQIMKWLSQPSQFTNPMESIFKSCFRVLSQASTCEKEWQKRLRTSHHITLHRTQDREASELCYALFCVRRAHTLMKTQLAQKLNKNSGKEGYLSLNHEVRVYDIGKSWFFVLKKKIIFCYLCDCVSVL